jgi:F-type H+-transporting ATPase subunit gamma
MASTTALKRRITSVKNTKQITKAMELVAASKMRRAQENALRSRDYRNLARAILTRIAELTDVTKHPLYRVRPIRTRLYILISSDRGLAGAYNSNLFRQLMNDLREDQTNGITSQVIAIGKQGTKFLSRIRSVEVLALYQDFPDQPTANDIRPILTTVIERFKDKQADAVDLIYTDYKSSISQVVASERLLPAVLHPVKIPKELEGAVFEPSVNDVLETITERLIEVQLSQALLESKASEHSMRMLAMKNASDNASEIIDDLTLEFNTARQAAITQELAEITGGAEAIR